MTDALVSLLDEELSAVPGAAVAVRHGGRLAHRSCHGRADLEWDRPVTHETVFRLASLSKPLTALAVRSLAADGLLDLDAPIAGYLPGLPHGDAVTVAHLLAHTSGIPNFTALPGFADRTSRLDHTDDEVIALFAGLPLVFEPGTRHHYSNSGYRLLDVIAARVAGAPFGDVLAERVFGPAGMTSSRLLDDTALVPHRARGYDRDGERFANAAPVSMTVPGGAGGLGSTLDDLVAFDNALHDGVFDLTGLHEPVRLACGRTEGYGHGWFLGTYRGRRLAYHSGAIAGFANFYARIPSEDFSVIVLTNLGGFGCGPLVRDIIDTVLGLPEPMRPTVALDGLADFAGVFVGGGKELTVAAEPGLLRVSTGDVERRMRPVAARTFADMEDPDVTLDLHDRDTLTLRLPLSWVTGHRRD
ncbi:serine hydrolase [Phytomonospora sp. NPDC050363]|uniref:serine hydrolase domain-containing protein n=1 Tax=Phytomonospora sp. NPDC050363 TaxID=3155642 RepID=UPI0033E34808